MASNKSLAVIGENTMRCLTDAETVRRILEDLGDVDNLGQMLMGRIKLGAGGMPAFSVFEPGEDEPEVAKAIEGVIVLSHKCNAYWSRSFEDAGDDKTPDCASGNGEEGLRRECGEIVRCAKCPYNAFGSGAGGKGKACRNMSRLYILREGDMFPMILTLPPSAIKAFDSYRVAIGMKLKTMHGIMTRITLTKKKNSGGIEYSAPVFEMIGELPAGDADRMKAYADSIGLAAMKAGITADDYAGDSESADRRYAEALHVDDVPPVPHMPPQDQGFIQVDEDIIPF